MVKFLIKKLKNNKGAMDSILVTLLLIIIGIGAVSGLSIWLSDATKTITKEANATLEKIISE